MTRLRFPTRVYLNKYDAFVAAHQHPPRVSIGDVSDRCVGLYVSIDASIDAQTQIKPVTHPSLPVSIYHLNYEGLAKTSSFQIAQQTKRSDVEIKNGKVVFRQKPMSFEKMTETMQGM